MLIFADIGGTHARFALAESPQEAWIKTATLYVTDFPSLSAALLDFLEDSPPPHTFIAIACPILDDVIQMTNCPWSFSQQALQDTLKLPSLTVVNDLEAIALAIPSLSSEQSRPLGLALPSLRAPIAVLAPGTGLGTASLMPTLDGSWQAYASEGGHATAGPHSEEEWQLLSRLHQQYGHVSYERLASGQGISTLYQSLTGHSQEPSVIAERACAGEKAACEALSLFTLFLGRAAGNLALTLGARGGVYLSGGILPKLGPLFDEALFRESFEAKGRFRAYLQQIPTRLICHPEPALQGLRVLSARCTIL